MRVFFVISFFLNGFACLGADADSSKYPSAILIQLKSEHNRIAALTKAKRYSAVKEVENDAMEVNKRFKLDFHNNFTYCPIYYYIDTNVDLIKNKLFDGILFNEDGTPAKDLVINSNSTDYIVAYYGYAVSQSRHKKVQTDSSKNEYDPDPPAGRGLVILNDKFQQLTYFYKFGYDDFKPSDEASKQFYYSSKNYEIEYYPFAKLFNETMFDRYGRRRIKNTKKDTK